MRPTGHDGGAGQSRQRPKGGLQGRNMDIITYFATCDDIAFLSEVTIRTSAANSVIAPEPCVQHGSHESSIVVACDQPEVNRIGP